MSLDKIGNNMTSWIFVIGLVLKYLLNIENNIVFFKQKN